MPKTTNEPSQFLTMAIISHVPRPIYLALACPQPKFFTCTLWPYPCGSIPAALSLRLYPCGSIPVALSLRLYPCGSIPAALSMQPYPLRLYPVALSLQLYPCLRLYPCGSIPVALSLWLYPCGSIPVALSLRLYPCGSIHAALSKKQCLTLSMETLGPNYKVYWHVVAPIRLLREVYMSSQIELVSLWVPLLLVLTI